LKNAQPKTTEDKAFRLMGLAWANADRKAVRSAAKSLLADQRADGGWAQIPTLSSDAYATGQALTVLRESGAAGAKDAACQRASQFLLSTQFERWIVVRQDSSNADSTLFRVGLSVWQRPIHLRRGHKLGDESARARSSVIALLEPCR
jgi:hypothetical protein